MATIKYSRQRESILNFLAQRRDHPTADTIYQAIRQEFPKISLGTVYRNLGLLTDLGQICRVNAGDGAERFDYNTAPHNHFICTKCHSVSDLEMESIDHIMEAAQQNCSGHIESYQANFYGICAHCLSESSH
ncbi:MAG: transcriptional repressor [Eubacteriales bacterium]|nr:transcriptional repressor [Eubacteriales bacterium]